MAMPVPSRMGEVRAAMAVRRGSGEGEEPGSWWCSVVKKESNPQRSACWASAIISSTTRVRSAPGAGWLLPITPNLIISALAFWPASLVGAPVDEPLGLALAAVGVGGQAPRGDQPHEDLHAEVGLEPVLEPGLELLRVGDAALH